jgi:hypothetical protein
MYEVNNDDNVAYTRNQLQVVKSDEKKPNSKLQKKVIIDEILERYKKGNKIYFKVKWSDGDETEEPRTSLIKDVPGLVEEFEDIEKNKPKIMSRFKVKSKIYYKVKWNNGTETDEAKTAFNKLYPTIVEMYEKSTSK